MNDEIEFYFKNYDYERERNTMQIALRYALKNGEEEFWMLAEEVNINHLIKYQLEKHNATFNDIKDLEV